MGARTWTRRLTSRDIASVSTTSFGRGSTTEAAVADRECAHGGRTRSIAALSEELSIAQDSASGHGGEVTDPEVSLLLSRAENLYCKENGGDFFDLSIPTKAPGRVVCGTSAEKEFPRGDARLHVARGEFSRSDFAGRIAAGGISPPPSIASFNIKHIGEKYANIE